ARAIGMTTPSARPARSSGRLVSPYPNTKASAIDSATVPALWNPAAVPIAMPATSPIAQPVRQCSVAETAMSQLPVLYPMGVNVTGRALASAAMTLVTELELPALDPSDPALKGDAFHD